VTLSTDLGSAYAAQIKAVLAHRLPPGRVVDLSHDLPPHDVREGGFLVRAMAERFPTGSVHLVVVDPGVGGSRVPVAVACRNGSVVIGPDNGVLVPLVQALGGGTAYAIDPARVGGGPRVGTTFDGRDLFAPAAARIARGASPRSLGPPTDLRPCGGQPPRPTKAGGQGTVVHVDRFGNLITDVPTSWVPRGRGAVRVRVGERLRRLPFVTSYEDGGRGHLVVLGSSFGTLEVAVVEGRASDRLRARVGTPVRFAGQGPATRSARRNRK